MANKYLDFVSQEEIYFISSAEKFLVTKIDAITVGDHPPTVSTKLPSLFLVEKDIDV